MTVILHIDASARSFSPADKARYSLSKAMAAAFIDEWQAVNKDDAVIHRDVGKTPPDFISLEWIDAVFTDEQVLSDEQQSLLALSNTLIDEVQQADMIVMSTPMYNYGMPASLKAWFDQVIRINKTFSFDLQRGDFPLEPTLSGKKLVLITSSGEFGFSPGGIREDMNHLSPHIRLLSPYLGVDNVFEINVEYQEFGDERHEQSLADAHCNIKTLVQQLTDC